MRSLCLIILSILLISCGTNHFAKRKYTKGVYVEKRSHGLGTKSKAEDPKYIPSSVNKKEELSEKTKTESLAYKTNPESAQEVYTDNPSQHHTETRQKENELDPSIEKKDISEIKNEAKKDKTEEIKSGKGMLGTGIALMVLSVILMVLFFLYVSWIVAIVSGVLVFAAGLTLTIIGARRKDAHNLYYDKKYKLSESELKRRRNIVFWVGIIGLVVFLSLFLAGLLTWFWGIYIPGILGLIICLVLLITALILHTIYRKRVK